MSVAALQILLALGLLAATQGPAFGQQSVGAVADLEGTARLSRGTQEFEVALKMAVIARDRIQTMSKSHLTVTLDGGSQLMLEESSTMVIDDVVASALSNSSISLKLGHLRAVVYPTLSATPNFEVHTPNAVVGVRGTEFETAYIEGKPCPGFPTCLRYRRSAFTRAWSKSAIQLSPRRRRCVSRRAMKPQCRARWRRVQPLRWE